MHKNHDPQLLNPSEEPLEARARQVLPVYVGRDHDAAHAEVVDAAVELGSSDAGARASFGGAPGDAAHPEPYLYVAPWGEIDRSIEYWNDEAFGGASLSYADLLAADDQRQAALTFYREGLDILRTG